MKTFGRFLEAWDGVANSLPLDGWSGGISKADKFLIVVREEFGLDVKMEWSETTLTLNGVIVLTAEDTIIFAHFKDYPDYNVQVLASPADPLGQRHRLTGFGQ